jgi:hypothetical protein
VGNSALWTAAHYRIPLLIVVANNVSFYNDGALACIDMVSWTH